MTKGLNRSRARGPAIRSAMIKLNIPLTALALSTGASGATGDAWASAVIRGLPEGNVMIIGAVANVQVTSVDAGLTTTWTGQFSIGTAATADAVLNGLEANVVGATTLTAATNKVSPIIRGAQATASIVDNTDRTLNLVLNLKVDDATISANNVALTASGFLSIAYVVLGDD